VTLAVANITGQTTGNGRITSLGCGIVTVPVGTPIHEFTAWCSANNQLCPTFGAFFRREWHCLSSFQISPGDRHRYMAHAVWGIKTDKLCTCHRRDNECVWLWTLGCSFLCDCTTATFSQGATKQAPQWRAFWYYTSGKSVASKQ